MTQPVANRRYKILVLDDSTGYAAALRQGVSPKPGVSEAISVEARPSLEGLQAETYDLVLEALHRHKAVPTVGLVSERSIDQLMRLARRYNVRHLLPRTEPFRPEDVTIAIHRMLQPTAALELEELLSARTVIETLTITSSAEIMAAYHTLRAFFEESGVKAIDDLSTAMIEAITNAVYHSPRLADGSRKYQKGQPIEALDPAEYVTIRYGRDQERIGVSIRDNGGRITAEEVMYWLDRNFSEEGLLDTHGRGIYLIHTLVDRLFINILPGQRTELVMVGYLNGAASGNKPLYINQAPG
jgi:anti-sigma regulatory factor (Ser/Thr protein kinase)